MRYLALDMNWRKRILTLKYQAMRYNIFLRFIIRLQVIYLKLKEKKGLFDKSNISNLVQNSGKSQNLQHYQQNNNWKKSKVKYWNIEQ